MSGLLTVLLLIVVIVAVLAVAVGIIVLAIRWGLRTYEEDSSHRE